MTHPCTHHEDQNQDQNQHVHHESCEHEHPASGKHSWLLPASIVFASFMIVGAWIYTARLKVSSQSKTLGSNTGAVSQAAAENDVPIDQELVIPSQGVELPIVWRDLGKRLADAGVIDLQKFESLYVQRGGLSQEMTSLLRTSDNGKIRITPENAQILLNISWALGLGNKNPVLDNGPMQDKQYGGAANFASTGGWSLAKGDAMQHYSKHEFITLTSDQQALVERVSKGIYRPCCGNSVYFPDCNHGMAMLGLLELMASQGVNEEEMYKAALAINSYWFPDTYLNIAKFMKQRGIEWNSVKPQDVLSANFSSSQGYRQVLSQVQPVQSSGGGGCGV